MQKVQDEEVRKVLSRYAKKMTEMVKSGYGLAIGGERGVGKTGAAAVLIKEAIRLGFTSYFVTHAEIRELQFNDRVFGDGSDGITVNQRILRAQFLVLDGFDHEFLTDKVFGTTHLERMLQRRSNNTLATVLTSRVVKHLKKAEYGGLFDLVRQSMLPVTINGRNLRDDIEAELRAEMVGG